MHRIDDPKPKKVGHWYLEEAACSVVFLLQQEDPTMARASLRYQGHRDPQEALRMRLREVAASRVRLGYRRLTVLLRRDGWWVSAKRIYRLYTEEGVMVRTKVRVRAARRSRVPPAMATGPNQRWSMDFMSERVADGRGSAF